MPCMTTSRYKAVPSGVLHSAAVRTNTSEGQRRALSPASDPKSSRKDSEQHYAARVETRLLSIDRIRHLIEGI
jgi:hypothetical protein